MLNDLEKIKLGNKSAEAICGASVNAVSEKQADYAKSLMCKMILKAADSIKSEEDEKKFQAMFDEGMKMLETKTAGEIIEMLK